MEREQRPLGASEQDAHDREMDGFEQAGQIGVSDVDPNDDDSEEALQRKAVQRAANESPHVQQLLSLQRNVNQAMQSGVVQRNVFKDASADYATEDGVRGSGDIHTGSTTKSIAYSTDSGLPTAWKVLKSNFGESNLDKSKLRVTSYDTLDRPRSISAEITSASLPERTDPITSDVGRIGNDELFLRQGDSESMYDGGHLIGAKILGPEAQEAYDLAPQEVGENENSYNNTIENVARRQGPGSIFQYDVNVTYPINNYSIDQQTLKDRGVLRDLDPLKPWNVYIPSRIPKTWSAEADLTSGGNWMDIDNATKRKSLVDPAAVDGADLSMTDRGAFHFSGDGTTKMTFHSQQYVPVDTVDNPKPSAFTIDKSLADPDSYEEALPSKADIVRDLPAIAAALETESTAYLAATNTHAARRYLDPLARSATRTAYQPSSVLGDDLRTEMENEKTRVKDLIDGYTRSSTSTVAASAAVDDQGVIQIYDFVYGREKDAFDAEVGRAVTQLTPKVNALLSLQRELEDLGHFGASAKDGVTLSFNPEAALQDMWKKAQKYRKRMNMVLSETAADRMDQIGVLGAELDRAIGTGAANEAALGRMVMEELKKDIRRCTTLVPAGLYATLYPTRRTSSRKRPLSTI